MKVFTMRERKWSRSLVGRDGRSATVLNKRTVVHIVLLSTPSCSRPYEPEARHIGFLAIKFSQHQGGGFHGGGALALSIVIKPEGGRSRECSYATCCSSKRAEKNNRTGAGPLLLTWS